MDDLKRTVWQSLARAYCDRPDCKFSVDGVWPKSAGSRARLHARQNPGHVVSVRYEHTTEYSAPAD